MNQHSNQGGKRQLVRDVMARGFSARTAAEAVNAVFKLMKEALSYHEPVELPGIGRLEVRIQKGKAKRHLQKTRNISSKQIEAHVVTFPGRRRVVKLKPDQNLKLPVDPALHFQLRPTIQPEPCIPMPRVPTVAHAYRSGAQPMYPRRYRRAPVY